MAPLLVLLALAANAPTTAERDTIVVHVLTPDDAKSAGRAKKLFTAAAEAILPRTQLRPIGWNTAKMTPQEVGRCTSTRRLGCWAKAARDAPYVLLLSIQDPQATRPQLTALLIDVAEAARVERSIDPFEQDREGAVEDAIFERAAVLRSERGALDTFFVATIDALKARFERTNHWRPAGSLAIRTDVEGLDVQIDEEPLGKTTPPVTKLADVTAGTHVLTLTDPDERYEKLVTDVTIELGAQTTLEPTLLRTAKTSKQIRSATAWTGVGLVVVGAALTIASFAVESDTTTVEPCIGTTCAEADPTFESVGGILLAPLGYSLVGAGAAWSGGTWLLTDEFEIPWLPIAIGVVLGGTAYALSAAVGG